MDKKFFFPTNLEIQNGNVDVKLSLIPTSLFNEPFFPIALQRLERLKNVQSKKVRIEELIKQVPPPMEPSFIFHSSQCGSTLVTQALTSSNVRVISEPHFFSSIINCAIPIEIKCVFFKAIIAQFFHQSKNLNGIVFKFHSRDARLIKLVKKSFPTSPIILMHRNPYDIMKSRLNNKHSTSLKSLNGNKNIENFLQISSEEFEKISNTELEISYLERIFECFLLEFNSMMFTLSYNEIHEEIRSLIDYLKIRISEEQYEKLTDRLQYKSKGLVKEKFQRFKYPDLPIEIISCIEKRIIPVYNRFLTKSRESTQ